MARRNGNEYKPLSIRLPYLITFLAAFCLCIGLIEYLLSLTVNTDTSFNQSLGKRQWASVPSFDSGAEGQSGSTILYASTETDTTTRNSSVTSTFFGTEGSATGLSDFGASTQHEKFPGSKSLSKDLPGTESVAQRISANTSWKAWATENTSSLSSNIMSTALFNTSTSTCSLTCSLAATISIRGTTTTTYTIWPSATSFSVLRKRDNTIGSIQYSTETAADGGIIEYETIMVGETECSGGGECPTTTIVPGVSTVTNTVTITSPKSTLMMITKQVVITMTSGKKKREVSYDSQTTSATARLSTPSTNVATSVSKQNTTSISTTLLSDVSRYITTTTWTTLARTTDMSGSVSDFLAVYISTITLASSPTASIPTSTTAASGVRYSLLPSEVVVRGVMSNTEYFLALFSAPLLAVAIRALNEPVVAALKLMEPFQSLSNLESKTSGNLLSAQYLASSISVQSIKLLRNGHLITFWSVLMHIVLTVATPLASAAMSVRARSMCIVNGWVPCNPGWIINIPIIRSVEAALLICCTLSIVIIFLTWKFHLKIPTNPSSISCLASLLNQEPFVRQLQKIDPQLDDNDFNAALSNIPVRLGYHKDVASVSDQYGLVVHPMSYVGEDLQSSLAQIEPHIEPKATKYNYSAVSKTGSIEKSRYQTMFGTRSVPVCSETMWDTIQLLLMLTLFSLLLAYYLDSNEDDIFNTFFNSKGLLPRILLISLATLGDTQMKDLERVVRVTEPYRRLSLKDGLTSVETTVLMPLSGTCWSNLPRCVQSLLFYKHSRVEWQTVVSIVAILSELNVIAVAGVPYNESMTLLQYRACTYTAVGITGSIIAVILGKMVWWSRVAVLRDMPRRPDTIGSVCGYLCGSEFIQWVSEIRLGEMSEEKRRSVILESGRRFCFERRAGTDGVIRWTVDFL